jgi:hypothetical protein
MLGKLIQGGDSTQIWQNIHVDLDEFKGQTVKIRIYQRVLIPGKEAGNAYWRKITINK